jgi:hypothetical protein
MTTRINPRLINPISGVEGSVASVSSCNVVFSAIVVDNTTVAPTSGQALLWDSATNKYKPGAVNNFGLYSSSVSNVAAYTVTTTMANAIVFPSTAGFSYIVDSILIANQDGTGLPNVGISSNIVLATGLEYNYCNVIPIPYRMSLDLLKKPQVFKPGEVLKLQGVNTSNLYATITFERIASNSYVSNALLSQLAVTTPNALTNLYVSSGAPTIIESIRLVNSGSGNVATTLYWASATGVLKTYFVSSLIIPQNCVVELCDTVKRLDANDRLVSYSTWPNVITTFVSGKLLA